ncbi:MAG: hypothetical protein L3J37_05595 [Rhodobacteraceae bacterium]|nr:hypothetical protein [Paracoccaceae bacterium]
MRKKLILHARPKMRAHIDQGQHAFSNVLRSSFEARGFLVKTGANSPVARWLAEKDRNLHIFHLGGATGPRALNMRRAFFHPFWSIEKPGSRHWGRMAQKTFDPALIDARAARQFFANTCKRILPKEPAPFTASDYALIPLQGKLLKHRKWQYADLATMVDTIRTHDPTREIYLKPHPGETYTEAEKALLAQQCQLSKVRLVEGDIQSLLANAAYLVTHNSAAAFEGLLHRKPAILFAKADFHHIFPTVKNPASAAAAFGLAQSPLVDVEKYLYWYLQLNCINAWREDAGGKAVKMIAEAGWQLPAHA